MMKNRINPILKKAGCNIKTVSNAKYGISYNISTKILSDTLCVMYKSLTRDMLEEHCSYNIVIQIKTYDYMGKSGKSMTSYIKDKTADKTITINKDILRLMGPAGVSLNTQEEEEEEEKEEQLLFDDEEQDKSNS